MLFMANFLPYDKIFESIYRKVNSPFIRFSLQRLEREVLAVISKWIRQSIST